MASSGMGDAFQKRDPELHDACLVVQGHRLWINTTFLSVHSPVLARMFRKARGNQIYLTGKRLSEVASVLECLVPSPSVAKVDEHNLESVVSLAYEWEIRVLQDACQKLVDEGVEATMNGGGSSPTSPVGATSQLALRPPPVQWTQQLAKDAALKAVSLSAPQRPPGPYAHLYEKPIPRYLKGDENGPGILSRPGPLALAASAAARSPANTNARFASLTASLGPNGAPSKALPINVLAQFGCFGTGEAQFNSPHGFCLNHSTNDVVVADTNNHRIQVFSAKGQFILEFGVAGREEGRLWYPRKVVVNSLRNNEFVVCDRGNERSRMQIFDRDGHFLHKIPIRFVDIVAGLAVDPTGLIVVVDSVSPSIFCINAGSGELVKWFDCSNYMKEPSDIACFWDEYYVCDFKGHCVCVFTSMGSFKRKIGCDKLTSFPNGIDISADGDVIIGDSHGNRLHLSVFRANGDFEAEFDCPHLKVSRCCGLRLTSDGHLITLAKNNNHILVMDTLSLDSEPACPALAAPPASPDFAAFGPFASPLLSQLAHRTPLQPLQPHNFFPSPPDS